MRTRGGGMSWLPVPSTECRLAREPVRRYRWWPQRATLRRRVTAGPVLRARTRLAIGLGSSGRTASTPRASPSTLGVRAPQRGAATPGHDRRAPGRGAAGRRHRRSLRARREPLPPSGMGLRGEGRWLANPGRTRSGPYDAPGGRTWPELERLSVLPLRDAGG